MDYLTHDLRFKDLLTRGKANHGDKFDPSELYDKWVPAYCTGERIRVRAPWGEVITGTVGVTTGWRPAFLLMRRSNARGSSIILDLNFVFTFDKCGYAKGIPCSNMKEFDAL